MRLTGILALAIMLGVAGPTRAEPPRWAQADETINDGLRRANLTDDQRTKLAEAIIEHHKAFTDLAGPYSTKLSEIDKTTMAMAKGNPAVTTRPEYLALREQRAAATRDFEAKVAVLRARLSEKVEAVLTEPQKPGWNQAKDQWLGTSEANDRIAARHYVTRCTHGLFDLSTDQYDRAVAAVLAAMVPTRDQKDVLVRAAVAAVNRAASQPNDPELRKRSADGQRKLRDLLREQAAAARDAFTGSLTDDQKRTFQEHRRARAERKDRDAALLIERTLKLFAPAGLTADQNEQVRLLVASAKETMRRRLDDDDWESRGDAITKLGEDIAKLLTPGQKAILTKLDAADHGDRLPRNPDGSGP